MFRLNKPQVHAQVIDIYSLFQPQRNHKMYNRLNYFSLMFQANYCIMFALSFLFTMDQFVAQSYVM